MRVWLSNRSESSSTIVVPICKITQIYIWYLMLSPCIMFIKHIKYSTLSLYYSFKFLYFCLLITFAHVDNLMNLGTDLIFLSFSLGQIRILSWVISTSVALSLLVLVGTVEPSFMDYSLLRYVGFFYVVAIALLLSIIVVGVTVGRIVRISLLI